MSRIPPLVAGTLAAAALVAAVLSTGPAPGSMLPPPPPPHAGSDAAAPAAGDPEAVPEAVVEEEPPDIVESRPSRWGEGEVPPRNRGTGNASLDLTLVGRATRQPVAARIRLWRLGVPEDDEWSAGDHVQARADVGEEGAVIADLPAGRYRIQCDDQRQDAEGPPEFLVEGRTRRSFFLDLPRLFPARVVVFDHEGRTVARARATHRLHCGYDDGPSVPDWAEPREATSGVEAVRWAGCGH